MSVVRLEVDGDVGVIVVDNPPVNALGPGVGDGIVDALVRAEADPAIVAMVLIGAGRSFIAGADIRQFGKGVVRPPIGARPSDRIDGTTKPIVAAIHGFALGGGLECALACHYRIATVDAKVGLPEVLIGILPGGGGTQRLPRLIGPAAALDLILSGRHVPAPEALALGIVDALVPQGGDLRTEAIALARRMAPERPLPRVRDRSGTLQPGCDHPAMFDSMRKSIARSARNQQAPQRCIDAVEASTTLGFDDGLRFERKLFETLESSDEAKGLRYAFFAEREAAKLPDVPKDVVVPPLTGVAIIGAGTMGVGIAMACADAGLPVKLLDLEPMLLDRSMQRIRQIYADSVFRGRLSDAAAYARVALIVPVTGYADIALCDVAIEAVFEELAIKQEVFARLDAVMPASALLLTNTSAFDIDLIASATSRRHAVAGAHFFSPANVMKLLEVVRGQHTSAQTLAGVMALGRKLGKTCVVVRSGEGFLANRSRTPFGNEMLLLLEEGALPGQVDRVMVEFGYPMGPFAVSDLAGLDIGYTLRKRRAERDPHYRKLPIADRLVEMGRLGQKTGAGWYRYSDGDRTPQDDPVVAQVITDFCSAAGQRPRAISDTEILHRLLFSAVNESCRIIAEGLVDRASDIDVAWVHGFGFPRYRGGLLFWADGIGAEDVLRQVEEWNGRYGIRWSPAPLLREAVSKGVTLNELKPGAHQANCQHPPFAL